MNAASEQSDVRYARHSLITWWEQARVAEAVVIVAGAGAVGNEVVKNLALLGMGRIVLIDDDVIELTNLSRSLFFGPGDVGAPKAKVVAQAAEQVNGDVTVVPLVGDIRQQLGVGLARRACAVIGAVDNIEARIELNSRSRRAGVPFIDGGLFGMSGSVQTYFPDGVCYECCLPSSGYQELARRYSCTTVPHDAPDGAVPAVVTSAAVVAGWQVQEAVKILHGLGGVPGRRVQFIGDSFDVSTTVFEASDDCLGHEEIIEPLITSQLSATHSTAGEVLAFGREHFGPEAQIEIGYELATVARCPGCRRIDVVMTPVHLLTEADGACSRCRQSRPVDSIHWLNHVGADSKLKLCDIGIAPAEILTVTSGTTGSELGGIDLAGDLAVEPLASLHLEVAP